MQLDVNATSSQVERAQGKPDLSADLSSVVVSLLGTPAKLSKSSISSEPRYVHC